MAAPVRTTFDANVDLIILVLTDVLEAMDRHNPEGCKFVSFTSYLPSTYNILNTREGLWIKLKITHPNLRRFCQLVGETVFEHVVYKTDCEMKMIGKDNGSRFAKVRPLQKVLKLKRKLHVGLLG